MTPMADFSFTWPASRSSNSTAFGSGAIRRRMAAMRCAGCCFTTR
jgi:hypothetical protein